MGSGPFHFFEWGTESTDLTLRVYQVKNFAFKTTNAEMQSTNCNVIYSKAKRPIN